MLVNQQAVEMATEVPILYFKSTTMLDTHLNVVLMSINVQFGIVIHIHHVRACVCVCVRVCALQLLVTVAYHAVIFRSVACLYCL